MTVVRGAAEIPGPTKKHGSVHLETNDVMKAKPPFTASNALNHNEQPNRNILHKATYSSAGQDEDDLYGSAEDLDDSDSPPASITNPTKSSLDVYAKYQVPIVGLGNPRQPPAMPPIRGAADSEAMFPANTAAIVPTTHSLLLLLICFIAVYLPRHNSMAS